MRRTIRICFLIALTAIARDAYGQTFDFAVDSLRVDGNIPGGYFEDFNNATPVSTTSPTPQIFCPDAPSSVSQGFLHLTSDGANNFTPGFLVANCHLGLQAPAFRLNKGSGNSTITASFRADPPSLGQAYGLQLFTFGTNELVNIQTGGSGGTDTIITALAQSASLSRVTQSVRVNLTGASRIFFRLVYDDATNRVTTSYSLDGGPFTEIVLPQPGTVMTTGNQAVVSVFGSVIVLHLDASVGNQATYLSWTPASQPPDSYNVHRDDGGTVTTTNVCKDCLIFLDFGLANGQLYKYTVSAVRNGVEILTSNFVFARPGEFAVSQPPPKPANPILFLHGFSSASFTWNETGNFLLNTLHWRFGGNLSYAAFLFPEFVDPTTTDPKVPQGCCSQADFFTVDFGDTLANYLAGKSGVAHQGDEVQGFIRALRSGGLSQKITLVGHSMGGMAARSYLADHPAEAVARVSQLITYGSPHWGASYASFFPFPSEGTSDLAFGCVNGRLSYTNSSFLEHLRSTPLPSALRYFVIRGHNDIPTHRIFTGGCLSVHWDGLIPLDSADLLVPQSAPSGQIPLTTNPIGLLTTSRFHTNETVDFSAILCALDLNCFILSARSPVDIEIAAPDSRSISRQLSEIPGASYMELPEEAGHRVAAVLIPFPLGGDYSIKVVPKPGASPMDTYTLEVTRAGVTTIVAQNQKVQDIPAQPYVVTVLPPIPIDIKPGDVTKTINPASHGKIPVAILSSPTFDALTKVDQSSLTFGHTGDEQSLAFCNSGGEDVNGDGILDLVCHFNMQDTGFTLGDTQGVLKGKTRGGIPFVGTDSVHIAQ